MALQPNIEAAPVLQRAAPKRPFGLYAITTLLLINATLIALDLSRSYVGLFAALGLPRWALGALSDADADRLLRILFAGGFAAVSIGIWTLRRWAWAALMILVGTSLSEGILRYMRGEPRYLIMLFNVLIVLYLNQRSVQRLFTHISPTQPRA
ncbi:MAG TPA: hypothetical protein VK864_17490 [Longimicrobiales bacterium]|nr:hypothetical protein [Longimicrobiales bacterium]